MTICIAAVADAAGSDASIILCADMLTSSLVGKAEINFKVKFLGGGWSALTAGMDHEIRGLMRLVLGAFKAAQNGAHSALGPGEDEIDETNILPLVQSALHARKREKVEAYVQGRFAISYDDFLARGKDVFPAEVHREAIYEIREMRLGAECIIAGFAGGLPYLVQTDDMGNAHLLDNFAVIGEGQHLATSVLLHRGHSDVDALDRSVYTVWEAKKYAEGATSVGEYTTLILVKPDGTRLQIQLNAREALRELYLKYGPKDLPGHEFDKLPEGSFKKFSFDQ